MARKAVATLAEEESEFEAVTGNFMKSLTDTNILKQQRLKLSLLEMENRRQNEEKKKRKEECFNCIETIWQLLNDRNNCKSETDFLLLQQLMSILGCNKSKEDLEGLELNHIEQLSSFLKPVPKNRLFKLFGSLS